MWVLRFSGDVGVWERMLQKHEKGVLSVDVDMVFGIWVRERERFLAMLWCFRLFFFFFSFWDTCSWRFTKGGDSLKERTASLS